MKFKVGDHIQRIGMLIDTGEITKVDDDRLGYHVTWHTSPESPMAHTIVYIDNEYQLSRKKLRNEFLKELLK
jgi:cytochrome oxidase assembly protein ShyY1